MSTKYRNRRTHSTNAFPTLKVGEIAANTANRQFAVGSAKGGAEGTPLPFIGVRVFSEDASYAQGDFVIAASCIQRAKGVVSPGAFSQAQWDALCPGTAGGNDTTEWSQATHGFTASDIGKPVYLSGSTWVLAVANDVAKTHGGVIREIVDTNTLKIQHTGYLEGISATLDEGGSMSAGSTYYLSPTNTGQITATAPAVEGDYIDAVFYALSSSTAFALSWNPVLVKSIANEVTVTQAAHGFVAGDRGKALTFTTEWGLALATNKTTLGVAVLVSVVDANTFTFVQEGLVSGISFASFTPGNYYYLSRITAGSYTSTKPMSDDGYAQPMAYAVAADTLLVGQPMFREDPAFFELSFPALAFSVDRGGLLAPKAGNYRLGDIIVDTLGFGWQESQTEDEAVLTIPCPEDWDGSDFGARFYWIGASAATPGDGIVMRVSAEVRGAGANFATPFTFSGGSDIIDTLDTAYTTIQLSPSVAVTPQGETPGPGKLLFVQFKRRTAHASDVMVGGAVVLAAEFQFGKKDAASEGW